MIGQLPKKLCLHVCRNYFPEVKAIIQQEQFADVTVQIYPPVCLQPQMKQKVLDLMHQEDPNGDDYVILANDCVLNNNSDLESGQADKPSTLRKTQRPGYCLHMLANPELAEYFSEGGGYLVTPGWLSFWRSILHDWGFDQKTARSFFQECSTRLVLLETGVDPQSTKNLADFADYVKLPAQVIPLGLDHFRLLVSKLVLEWQTKQKDNLMSSAMDQANQQVANYALAFDLLADLTRMMSEADAMREIEQIFDMLFSPQDAIYISISEGRLLNSYPPQTSNERSQKLYEWTVSSQEEYHWQGVQDSFYLRISHQLETLGAVEINRVAFPQYSQQYLNMSLVLAPLFGLAISKARAYQKLEENEVKLQQLALTDPLTGLYNRRHLLETAETEFKRSRRYQHPLSAIMIDIDHFKPVNDTYGHAVGDRVLVEVSHILKQGLRESDIPSRLGGDEFLIILTETALPLAKIITDRLCKGIADLVIQGDDSQSIKITASLGVASIDDACVSLENLIHRSDLALYEAKTRGRNQSATWER